MSTATLTSFGYLRRTPPPADITVDVREHLRDPHINPALRELTGHDPTVTSKVLATPGAHGLIQGLVVAISGLLTAGRPVQVAIGCAGGRQRSVVLTTEIADWLRCAGWDTHVVHLDVGKRW